jgi:hypothetical protein
MSMAETGNNQPAPLPEGGQLPATLFKNSLRLWQARWQAQQVPGTPRTTTPRKVLKPSRKARRGARAE